MGGQDGVYAGHQGGLTFIGVVFFAIKSYKYVKSPKLDFVIANHFLINQSIRIPVKSFPLLYAKVCFGIIIF